MPNYCRDCCKKYNIKYDPTGKTCYAGMGCGGCGKRLWWYEEELFDNVFEHKEYEVYFVDSDNHKQTLLYSTNNKTDAWNMMFKYMMKNQDDDHYNDKFQVRLHNKVIYETKI